MNPYPSALIPPQSTDLPWWVPDPMADVREVQRNLLESGRDVIDLSMINPDMQPPRYILDRLLESVTKPSNHRYAVSRGVRKLREAFAEKYRSQFGVTLDPESEVCVTLGCKDALRHALSMMITTGDRVLIGKPTYPVHISAVKLAGGDPVFFETDQSEALMLEQIEALIDSQNVKVVLLNFPNNPTGQVVTRDFFEKLVSFAHARGVKIINDFVYGDMVFGGVTAPSVLSVPECQGTTVEVYSLSKAYNVPGWRVGALVGDSEIVQAVARLKSHADYGLFLPLQHAATAALMCRDNLVRSTTTEYERRAKVTVKGLQRLGWKARIPSSGASVWAEIPESLFSATFEQGTSNSKSIAFVKQLLQKQNVLLSPGYLFGAEYDRFVRLALVTREERIREVLDRLEEFTRHAQINERQLAASS